jgi:alpha-beta hydrolase superfamily lysophospholipase
MGGNIAIQVANRQPHLWNGVVLLAPAIVPHKATAAPWMVSTAR